MTFLDLAKRVLDEEKKPLNGEEIWQIAQAKGYDKLVGTKGLTPGRTIGAQLYVHIRDRKDSPFAKTGGRPKRFLLRTLLTNDQLQELEQQQEGTPKGAKKINYLERELHPFLAYYANFYLKAYTKTINHSKSDKKEFGEWIHPDMVGCYFPVEDWKPEVIEFGSTIGSFAIKLFSFELKRELDFSNLREAFFQTVSNSSWANEGYLVASEISDDVDFVSELRRLSSSFGIGVIKINSDDPDSSEVIFPPRTKDTLDWDAINKLTISPDLKEFLKRVRNDISSNEIRKEKYDKVLDRDTLISSIKK